MKQTRLLKILAAGAIYAAAVGFALAQETTTTTTTTDPVTGTTTTQQTTTSAAGTIVTYTPDSDYITFRTAPDAAPVRYYYTKDTTILDPEGRVVTWSAIRPDLPATIYYTTVGEPACHDLQARGNDYHNDKTVGNDKARMTNDEGSTNGRNDVKR